MEEDFKILNSQRVSGVKKLVREYSMDVGNQKVGIKIYLDSNGYYQMDTSHYYRGEGKTGVYLNSADNFESEEEALSNAKKQILNFYDGKGEWRENEDFNL